MSNPLDTLLKNQGAIPLPWWSLNKFLPNKHGHLRDAYFIMQVLKTLLILIVKIWSFKLSENIFGIKKKGPAVDRTFLLKKYFFICAPRGKILQSEQHYW
jgi:hypothetical protein